MINQRRQDLVLHALAKQLAPEAGMTIGQVLASLHEAIDAGLLRVTRNGVQAVIPTSDDT